MTGRVSTDGKFFRIGQRRFDFRGATYGTFEPRGIDGARFPDRDVLKRDLADMQTAGFTVVRTYTPPPDDLLELAADCDLRVLAGVFYPDWRYLVGGSRREWRRITADARRVVRAQARRLADNESVLALSVGNEIPADVVRWLGTERVARALSELVDVVRGEDPEMLVTYANYPTAEYLPLDDVDFLMFNVFLERQTAFRRYLTRLHHLAGDRPLVLGEVGLDASGGRPEAERRQADTLEWQLATAHERGVAGTCVFSWTDEWWVGDAAVEGWHFGLTRADRSPRPSLAVASRWNQRTVRDVRDEWPSMSVVICAYNADATLDESLTHTCALDYPNLEIIVVDDGSTDATASIARQHGRARLVEIEHAGLSVARNAGFEAAHGELVVYLDSDAYPSPEWPYFLALGLDGTMVGGVGGPNVAPTTDAIGAHQVARAPGGPLHVLVGDNRAEHIPGCNMAFLKDVLVEVGGFDPVFESAGDDVDLCWRVLDAGWDIGFHPAALVWHHRRPGLRPYLRQQRGYGRSEALVEARHPDRFTRTGSARWRGRIYDSFPASLPRQRIYRGVYGAAAYQSVYRSGGYALDLAHQVGLPVMVLALLTAPAAALSLWLAAPAVAALVGLVILAGIDIARVRLPRGVRRPAFKFRFGVAVMHLLQPLVRTWGRLRARELVRKNLPGPAGIPGPVHDVGRGVLLFPDVDGRANAVASVVTDLRRAGLRIVPATGWEDFDARVIGSAFVRGDVVTSAHPIGSVQLRVRRAPRWIFVLSYIVLVTLATAANGWLGAVLAVAGALDAMIGLWRTGGLVQRTVRGAAGSPT